MLRGLSRSILLSTVPPYQDIEMDIDLPFSGRKLSYLCLAYQQGDVSELWKRLKSWVMLSANLFPT